MKHHFKWLLGGVLVVGVGLAISQRDAFAPELVEGWIESLGWMGVVLFMLLYALSTVFFMPGSVLTLLGGALFGPVLGTLANLTGATLGATLAFLLSRYLASDWVERKSAGRLKQLKAGVEKEGWRFVAFTRLVPLFPFNLLNYALGLTRISMVHYVVATWLFMLPGALAYTYLGYIGREAAAGGEALIQKGLFALSLLALVAFLPRLVSRMRGSNWMVVVELLRLQAEGRAPLILDVRTEADFAGELGHIFGSVNLPLEGLDVALSTLVAERDSPIVCICRTDKRSKKAAAHLKRAGFSQVRVVDGGMLAWNALCRSQRQQPAEELV